MVDSILRDVTWLGQFFSLMVQVHGKDTMV